MWLLCWYNFCLYCFVANDLDKSFIAVVLLKNMLLIGACSYFRLL